MYLRPAGTWRLWRPWRYQLSAVFQSSGLILSWLLHCSGLFRCRIQIQIQMRAWLNQSLFFLAAVSELLPENYTNKVMGVMQYKEPFRFSFAIHCRSLLDDFHEDLEFRFSLGLTQLIRRFMLLRSSPSGGASREKVFGGGSMVSWAYKFFHRNLVWILGRSLGEGGVRKKALITLLFALSVPWWVAFFKF